MRSEPVSAPASVLQPVAFVAPVIVLPLLAALWLAIGFTWPCPLKLVSGLPCVACGGIRSLAALAQFDVLGALRWNPLVALLVLSLPVMFVARRKSTVRPVLLWFAIGVNWAYLLFFLPK